VWRGEESDQFILLFLLPRREGGGGKRIKLKVGNNFAPAQEERCRFGLFCLEGFSLYEKRGSTGLSPDGGEAGKKTARPFPKDRPLRREAMTRKREKKKGFSRQRGRLSREEGKLSLSSEMIATNVPAVRRGPHLRRREGGETEKGGVILLFSLALRDLSLEKMGAFIEEKGLGLSPLPSWGEEEP